MDNLFETMLMSFAKNSPQMNAIQKEIESSGMSAEELFYKKAKEQGIDPESILKLLR